MHARGTATVYVSLLYLHLHRTHSHGASIDGTRVSIPRTKSKDRTNLAMSRGHLAHHFWHRLITNRGIFERLFAAKRMEDEKDSERKRARYASCPEDPRFLFIFAFHAKWFQPVASASSNYDICWSTGHGGTKNKIA